MRLIKLTDADGYTQRGKPGETLWLPPGMRPPRLDGTKLCQAGVYHAYCSPEQAALMDPIHGCYLPNARVWWAEGEVVAEDSDKLGCAELVLVESAELPELSAAVRVRAAIYCARALLEPGAIPAWDAWAARWLAGERDAADAWAAERAAWAAAAAAAWAEAAAAWAAAAWAAASASAWAAAWAAEAADTSIDLTDIVRRALAEEADSE